jgi:hypothetical protein
MILLDSLIIFGMIFSYTPQYMKILSLQNSFGFSPNFFLLGSIGVVSTLSNLILLQFYGLLDCFTHNNNIHECISNLFGIIEIFVQFCCFFSLFVLFLWFFPVRALETLPTTPRADSPTLPSDSTDNAVIAEAISENVGNTDQESLNIIWQHSKRNAWSSLIFFFLSILLVSTSLVYCSTQTNTQIALVYGLLSTICGIVQFFPQLLYTLYTRKIGSLSVGTMILQVPGSFILVFSLYSTPGSNWTSYISYLISGLLQASLLIVCLSIQNASEENVSEEEETLLEETLLEET